MNIVRSSVVCIPLNRGLLLVSNNKGGTCCQLHPALSRMCSM